MGKAKIVLGAAQPFYSKYPDSGRCLHSHPGTHCDNSEIKKEDLHRNKSLWNEEDWLDRCWTNNPMKSSLLNQGLVTWLDAGFQNDTF